MNEETEPEDVVEPGPDEEDDPPRVPQPRRKPDYQQGAVGGCVHCG